ncbi:MAG: hypothetical protein JWO24_2550, partial [Rhodospirillales bacterium]|nr:hypothetical protein [Rhodospirillales bacterium]
MRSSRVPRTLHRPAGVHPWVIGGRVEAVKTSVWTLQRSVVLTANGTEFGRGTLPDARRSTA